jgi:flavin-dependent dehydrogenase
MTAISAIRQRNAKVLVSEEHQISGVPTHCSGLFSSDGLESLKDFIDYRKLVRNRMTGALVHLGDSQLRIETKKEVAFVCDRAAFDQQLAANAEKEGATVEYGNRITRDTQLRSTNVVGADGPNSFIANCFGFPRIRSYVNTLQAVLPYAAEDLHKVEVFLSNSRFPGFFGWVIPHDEETAEFGCGSMLPHNVNKSWLELLKLKGVRRTPAPTGAIIPISVRKQTAKRSSGRNVLLVGDAAGQVKATTGGGVIFGGNCARIAGKYFNDPLHYELSWKRRYLPDLLAHNAVHHYLAGKSDEQLTRLGTKLKAAGLEQFLSSKGHMDKPSRMLGFEAVRVLLKGLLS